VHFELALKARRADATVFYVDNSVATPLASADFPGGKGRGEKWWWLHTLRGRGQAGDGEWQAYQHCRAGTCQRTVCYRNYWILPPTKLR